VYVCICVHLPVCLSVCSSSKCSRICSMCFVALHLVKCVFKYENNNYKDLYSSFFIAIVLGCCLSSSTMEKSQSMKTLGTIMTTNDNDPDKSSLFISSHKWKIFVRLYACSCSMVCLLNSRQWFCSTLTIEIKVILSGHCGLIFGATDLALANSEDE